MSFISLVRDRHITLATDQLVYSPQEVNAIESVAKVGATLSELFNEENERVQQAIQKGHAEGYEEGFNVGKEEGQRATVKEMTEQLLAMAEKAEEQRRVMRGAIIELAILAVRKIAGEIGASEAVSAMAERAANELAASEALVLRVHPSVVEDVRTHLAKVLAKPQDKGLVIDIKPDEALDPFGCVLVSEQGEVIASLDEQLLCLEKSWRESLETNTK